MTSGSYSKQRAKRAVSTRDTDGADALLISVLDQSLEPIAILRGLEIRYLNTVAIRELGYQDLSDALGKSVVRHVVPAEHERLIRHLALCGRPGLADAGPQTYQLIDGRDRQVEVKVVTVPIRFEGEWAVAALTQGAESKGTLKEQLLKADRLASVGTLTAGIAHEINNPLAYLLLNVEYVIRKLPDVVDEPGLLRELRARMLEVRSGGQRVADIVRDLGTFARGGDDVIGNVNAIDALEAALRMCQHELPADTAIEREYPPLCVVQGNMARLEQVFVNVLLNAAHALRDADRDGVRKLEIGIRPSRTDGNVTITIEDNGPGLDDLTIQKAFEPFFTTKPSGVGTGLGLPICRSIVERFGGSLRLSNRETGGASVEIALRAAAQLDPRQPISTPVPSRIRTHAPEGRVLIIDDDTSVARSLKLHLRELHEVTTVPGGEEALRLLTRSPDFDCILCDIVMPRMTGVDFYETLQLSHPHLADRVVFMTGGAFTERAARFLSTCDRPILRKPFQLAALTRTLERTILRTRQKAEASP